MKCEYCEKEHDGSYASGRFCSPKCARSFSTSKNRQEINRKRSSSMKKRYDYINYKGKLITINEYNKITKSYEERIKRRSQLAVEIELEKSPYSEFDTAYNNLGSKKDCYYLTKHDDNNKIIKRAIVPKYRYTVEFYLGRRLLFNEVIHHVDNNHFNNCIENLMILERKLHTQLHMGVVTIDEIIAKKLYIGYWGLNPR